MVVYRAGVPLMLSLIHTHTQCVLSTTNMVIKTRGINGNTPVPSALTYHGMA